MSRQGGAYVRPICSLKFIMFVMSCETTHGGDGLGYLLSFLCQRLAVLVFMSS